jgi:HAE1 family hydrophobic/amphiphilic exporter-1
LQAGAVREIHVEVDPRLLDAHSLSMGDVSEAINHANASAPGGTILQGRYRYALRTLGELRTVEEIRGIQLVRPGQRGSGLAVRDVARVSDGFADRESMTWLNGREAVGLLVFKNANANTVRVAARVDGVVDELRREYPQLELEVAMSQAGFIRDALANVLLDVVLGGVLAFLVLFLFLREWRYPVAVALAIPISLVSSFALMHVMGLTLNLLSLGGLALGVGMLMDNSIVVLENIFRHREKGIELGLAAVLGTEEVQRAVTASTLTTIAVFGPIMYVQGVAGQLLGALAWSVAFSLLASIVVAVTLLPLLAARWARRPQLHADGEQIRVLSRLLNAFDRVWNHFSTMYGALLDLAMRRRVATLAIAFGLVVLGTGVGISLPRRVLPEVDQGSLQLRVALPRGTPLESTAAIVARVEAIVRSDDAVVTIFSQVGRRAAVAGIDEGANGTHTATVDVRLHPDVRAAAVIARLRAKLSELPAGVVSLETGEVTALGRLLGGSDAALALRVRGDDQRAALQHAALLADRLRRHPELTNVRIGTETGQPELSVVIDRERAAARGVTPARIADAVARFHGEAATELMEFDRRVPIIVRPGEGDRRSAAALAEVRVDGVLMRELVQIHATTGPAEIQRVDQHRVVVVEAGAAGGLGEALSAASAAVRDLVPPRGIHVEVGGENEELRRGFRDLALAFLLAVLLVYMLLAAEFESLLHPFVVILAVPLAAVGSTLALWVSGHGINMMSLIGLVILVGIVDNDAVVKVDFINHLRRQGLDRHAAIREAGHARLRPIVMNSITAMLGLLPMALGVGPGAELQAPLAIALFGGLLSATALTLLVIPVCYDGMDSSRTRQQATPGTRRQSRTGDERSPSHEQRNHRRRHRQERLRDRDLRGRGTDPGAPPHDPPPV